MSIFDTGFVWGDGVYDVTSTWNGWFFMLDEHLERFARSCEGFRLENPYSFEEMRRICAECVDRAGLSNAYVKMQITRGVPPPGSGTRAGSSRAWWCTPSPTCGSGARTSAATA